MVQGELESYMQKNEIRTFSHTIYKNVLCLVTQLCSTLCGPMDVACQAPLSLGILQARILLWVAIPSSKIFPTQGLNPGLLHCRQILYHLSHQGSPYTKIKDQNVRLETTELLQRNIGRTLFDINHSNIFCICFIRQRKQKQK